MAEAGCGVQREKIENGTDKIDKVALRDLGFWLPLTKGHLRNGIPFVSTYEALLKLPIAQIGFILAIVIKIIRKNRVVGGDRMSNCTLKVKADA